MNSYSGFNTLTTDLTCNLLPMMLQYFQDEKSWCACDEVCHLWNHALNHEHGFWNQLCTERELPLVADATYKEIFFAFRRLMIPASTVAATFRGVPNTPPITFKREIFDFLKTDDPIFDGNTMNCRFAYPHLTKGETFLLVHVPRSIQMSALSPALTLEGGCLMPNTSPNPSSESMQVEVPLSSSNVLFLMCCRGKNLQEDRQCVVSEQQSRDWTQQHPEEDDPFTHSDFLTKNCPSIFLIRGKFESDPVGEFKNTSIDFSRGKEVIKDCVAVTSGVSMIFRRVRVFQKAPLIFDKRLLPWELGNAWRVCDDFRPGLFLMIDPNTIANLILPEANSVGPEASPVEPKETS